MTAYRQNFSMSQRKAKRLRFTLSNIDGQPMDLTGAAVRWVLQETLGGSVLLSKSLGSGITLDGASTLGILFVDVNEDEVVQHGAFYHELLVTPAGGQEQPFAIGDAFVIPSTV
jgi:hypothetical protein